MAMNARTSQMRDGSDVSTNLTRLTQQPCQASTVDTGAPEIILTP